LLSSDADVIGVVTNPDRPAGRGMKERPPPVKETAVEAGLDVLQPASARSPEFLEELRGLRPDVAVVVAYGKILPVDLLEVPPHGFVNVHFSVLPEYRGAAPVQRAVMEGKDETGVSIMVLTEGMDEGPVLAIETTPIGPTDTAGAVGERLADVGARLLVDTLPRYVAGELQPRDQDDAAATYAPKLTPEEAHIDWTWPAERIDPFVRGLDPVPGAWALLEDKRLKVEGVRDAGSGYALEPGRIAPGKTLVVGTGTGPVELTRVQLAGKKRMSGEELLRGLRLPEDARLS
jgi:methionyl-tRNA formyltransferase